MLKKSADEIGKLRDEYAGGVLQLLMLRGWGQYMMFWWRIIRKGDMRLLPCLLYRMCSVPTTSDSDQGRNRLGWRRRIGVQAVLRRGEERINGG